MSTGSSRRTRLVLPADAAVATGQVLLSTAVIMAAASLMTRDGSTTGRPLRLLDVGDDWRALLLGAPPTLL